MRPPQLQLTESMASSTKGPQVIHDSDSEPEANDTVPIHNRRSTRSLPRQEHYRNTHFATPHKPQSKQARTRLRHRINGQSRTDEASTVGFDGQDNRAAGSEKTLDPSLTSKRERTTITPETTSLGFRSEKPQQLSTGINAAPVRGTFASKSSNKSRHARVPIPLRSPSQPAAQRVDAVPEPPRPRTPVPHTQPASRIGSDNESDASEDILGPMDRARRRRKEHAGPNATTEETPNAIKLHQERIEPTALTHVLEEPRGKGHKLGRPKVSSETANSTPVLEASTITLTSPTAAEVGRFQSILRHHIERFKETHGRYVKQSLSRARQQIKYDAGADLVRMSTKVPVSPRAGALSSTLKAPLALVLSKCRALGDAGVAASAEQVKQLNVISYRSETPSVPPFDYHSRAKVNKLAQNDRTLAAMPNIEQHEIVSVTGATDPDEDADFIEEVAEHFDMGLPYEHDRDEVISRLERYKQLQPSIFEFLDELDCSVEAIVRLFLDKNVKAGGPRCPYSSKALRARALGEKSRLQQFLDEWPRLENTLSATSLAAERLDAALRASFAFQEEVGMSIWPIAEVWLRRRMGLQATREVRESIAHATSICRICQVFDCRQHGSFPEKLGHSDGTGTRLDSLHFNQHKGVQSGQPRLQTMTRETGINDEVSLIRTPSARTTKGGRSSQSRASNINSASPETRRQTPLVSNPVTADTGRCSKHCALDRKALDAAPYTDIEETLRRFSMEDQALARSLMPALCGSPEASCIVAAALNKQCRHVHYFLKQLEMLTAPTATPAPDEPAILPLATSLPQSAKWWAENTKTSQIAERRPFFPCSHGGPCGAANCSCFQQGVHCEKTCGCSLACERRFRGCGCEQKGIPCRQGRCDCYRLMRECDPDLCVLCGAVEALDPALKDQEALNKCCGNVSIQRGLPKRLIMGTSQVKNGGFGLFAGEAIQSGELLGEYKGEVVSKEEAERRKCLYKRMTRHYTFDLNAGQEIDGTHSGNKMRFVNNSRLARNINCEQYHKLCNTVSRIGLYATRDIQPGEELFFDYGYPADQYKHFGEKKFTSVVAVKEKSTKKPASAGRHDVEVALEQPLNAEDVIDGLDQGSGVGDEEKELMIRPATFHSDDEADEDYDEPEAEIIEQAPLSKTSKLGRPAGQKTRGKKRKRFA